MVAALFGCLLRRGGARAAEAGRVISVGRTVVQASMSRFQVALLGLGLLLMLLLYVGLPGPPEQTSWLWGDPNVTILAGLTPGDSPIFYREVLPLHRARRPRLSSCMGNWTASWPGSHCGGSATCPTTPW
uniref:Abhydrolase domain containing 14A n=1 Tax=Rousettus aegyptiacus TaxID=9407 RepID=A0A7J8HLK5_ROUAE|nr:abhydrolase domain containing 14A [Rousettus aegyptiacus]